LSCGGGTEIAVTPGCKLMVSADSDQNWVEALKRKEAIPAAIERRGIFFDHVDIGPVGAREPQQTTASLGTA